MRILIIDNYDSFTFNLYQAIGELLIHTEKNYVLDVKRNDEITVDDIKKNKYNRIIISPGPGAPSDKKYFGVCGDVITEIGRTTPILGVCLGLQGIVQCFGGRIIKVKTPRHGKTSKITHNSKGVFFDLPQDLEAMRYHSLVVDPDSVPACIEVTAQAEDDKVIMGLRHKEYPIEGVQFHPESFATEGGQNILRNFLFPD